MSIDLLEKPDSHSKLELVDPAEEVTLEANKRVHFETALNNTVKEKLVNLLKHRITTFAWNIEDVTCVDPTIITHKLSKDDSVKSVQQKKKGNLDQKGNK